MKSLAGELARFAVAARGGLAAPLATVRDGAAVMAVIEAGRRSAAAGGAWEAVLSIQRRPPVLALHT
jgi:predicted dehydrogenase